MAKRKLPYMKMWVGDWLSSQKVMELTPMEEFCYFRLIMWAWQANASGLLNKDYNLAQQCRVDMDTWLSVKDNVLALFEVRDDRLFHHKVDEQVQQQKEISEKRAAAGRLGGRKMKPTVVKQMISNCKASVKQKGKQKVSKTPYDYSSSSDSSSDQIFGDDIEDVREQGIQIRDCYLKEICSKDQTRTQALAHINNIIMEELYSPDSLIQAIDRYALEVKASGAEMTKSCARFFSERLYIEFLRDDWTEPEIKESIFDEDTDPLESLKKRASEA